MDANKNGDNANDLWINNLEWNEMEIRYRRKSVAVRLLCLTFVCLLVFCLYLKRAIECDKNKRFSITSGDVDWRISIWNISVKSRLKTLGWRHTDEGEDADARQQLALFAFALSNRLRMLSARGWGNASCAATWTREKIQPLSCYSFTFDTDYKWSLAFAGSFLFRSRFTYVEEPASFTGCFEEKFWRA